MKKFLIFCFLFMLPMFASAQLIACRDSIQDGYNFWLYVPEDYNDTVADKPVVLFLHGKSLCGKNLANVLRYGSIDALKRGREIDAFVIAPQTQDTWKPDKVHEVYDWVKERYQVDTCRLYVLGMSLGGYGTINFTATYPDEVAAAMALCGGASIDELCGLNEVPLWIIHGTADKDVPIRYSQKVVDAMVQCGDTSRLIFDKLPREGHSHLARAFYLQSTYDWLFKHNLNDSLRPVNREYAISSAIMAKAYDGFDKSFTFHVIDSLPHQKPDVHKFHIVKKGETLSKIAVEHGTTVTLLCKLNNMKKTDILRIGRKIRVK
jgi:LysM repeat protein